MWMCVIRRWMGDDPIVMGKSGDDVIGGGAQFKGTSCVQE